MQILDRPRLPLRTIEPLISKEGIAGPNPVAAINRLLQLDEIPGSVSPDMSREGEFEKPGYVR
jgi:hypothetical protein